MKHSLVLLAEYIETLPIQEYLIIDLQKYNFSKAAYICNMCMYKCVYVCVWTELCK